MWATSLGGAGQGRTENLPESRSQTHSERGKDKNYPLPKRASSLSGNTTRHWKRGHSTGGHDIQWLSAAYQTPLNGFRNGHDGSKRGTHQETPRERVLHDQRTPHHKARLDTSGCRPNHRP